MSKQEKKLSVFGHYRKALGNRLVFFFIFVSCFFILGTILGNVIIPNYYKKLIDAISSGEEVNILGIIYMILAAGIFQVSFDRFFAYSHSRIISSSFIRIGNYSLKHITNHSYQFFANNFVGSIVTKFKRFVIAIEHLSDFIVRDFLYAIVSVVGILILLFINNFLLGLMALVWFTIFFSSMVFFAKKRLPLEREKSKMESRVTGVLSDIVTNIINLKLFSSRNKESEDFDQLLTEDHDIRMKSWGFADKAYTFQAFVTVLAQSSLIFFSFLLWQKSLVTTGTIVLTISYGGILFSRLSGLGSAIRRFTDSYTNAKEFTDILNESIEIVDPKKPKKLMIKEGDIEFSNVCFKYNNGSYIFKDFELRVKPGEKVGIIGTSGAGKTTITKLLLRFADVTKGSIKIDGQDIRDITQDDLRSVISYVPQDPILFHRTLKENIGYGKPSATEEEIMEASKQAHADDFIKGLRDGYQTLVGERGIKLSGGERQRVAIARAILKNAPILILDEATSALDSVSETHIKDALSRLMQGKTTIVIAHRLSTIEKMDRIIVLEKGKIVEDGNHTELIEKKGVYYNFWNHQNGGFIE